MQKTIEHSYKQLSQQLMNLRVDNRTALGPAVLSSIALASEGAPGS